MADHGKGYVNFLGIENQLPENILHLYHHYRFLQNLR